LKDARAAIEVPANGRIVVPGFVDAHVSLKIDTAHSGEKQLHRRQSMLNFYDDSLSLLRSCLHHGTLTADVKASGGESNHSLDIPVLRKLAEIGSNPICAVRTWHVGATPLEQLNSEFAALFSKIVRKKLIRFVEFDRASGHTVDPQLLALIGESQIGIKLSWAGAGADELVRCLEQFSPVAVYCIAPAGLTADEVRALAGSSSLVVIGAGKEIFEGPPLRTGREMVDAGAAIALASGYDSGSAASFSMQMSLALAVVRLELTAEEAFSAATINAAYAAGRGDEVGSIEVGKKADLLLLNASDYREVPSQFGVNHVDMVIRDGNIVLNRTRWKAMHN
ncbi:MAG: amidohydrolase family protein, partial [Acidobacteriaceae bacterium]|nr:amidohydrolase family protein [Acidobacteriaceae bacterium]